MKTRFYFPMIISLLVISVSLLTACGDSDNPLSDTTKPVIDLKSPAEGGVAGNTKELTLDYNQNFISFDYAVLRYGASQKNMCYIKLEGLDKDWILVDNTPRISYSNLRPGNYKLRIKSSNSTGEWKETCTLDICILPPWWASSWAYTFYGALLLIAFIMFYFYVKRRIYQKQTVKVWY